MNSGCEEMLPTIIGTYSHYLDEEIYLGALVLVNKAEQFYNLRRVKDLLTDYTTFPQS